MFMLSSVGKPLVQWQAVLLINIEVQSYACVVAVHIYIVTILL